MTFDVNTARSHYEGTNFSVDQKMAFIELETEEPLSQRRISVFMLAGKDRHLSPLRKWLLVALPCAVCACGELRANENNCLRSIGSTDSMGSTEADDLARGNDSSTA